MPRRRKVGDEVVSTNGYSYTYVEEHGLPTRRLTHWIVAEKKYGRGPGHDERVIFVDGDRTNLDPSNIVYRKKADPIAALKRRRATLEDRISEATAELDDIKKALKDAGVNL